MMEVFERDPPKKSHIVATKIDDSTIITECGFTFVQPNGELLTFEYDPTVPTNERTYIPPVPEAQCDRCSWNNEDE